MAPYCTEQSLEIVSCGLTWLIDEFCLVHIEILKTFNWLPMHKSWESLHTNLDFWLILKS